MRFRQGFTAEIHDWFMQSLSDEYSPARQESSSVLGGAGHLQYQSPGQVQLFMSHISGFRIGSSDKWFNQDIARHSYWWWTATASVAAAFLCDLGDASARLGPPEISLKPDTLSSSVSHIIQGSNITPLRWDGRHIPHHPSASDGIAVHSIWSGTRILYRV